MKVYQGPYHHWFQPYRWLKNWMLRPSVIGEGEKFDLAKHDAVEDWIRKNQFCQALNAIEAFFDRRHTRRIKVRIDPWDVWGAYHTLAIIIVPLLKLLKEKKQGSPFTDDDDVPEELRSTAAPPSKEYESDGNIHARWAWILDEMIWAMEQVADEDSDSQFFDHSEVDEAAAFSDQARKVRLDKVGYEKHQARVQRGLRFFGRYFEALWD